MFSSGLARRITLLLLIGLCSSKLFAQDLLLPDRLRFDSMGDYGNVGLLQMPSARMAADGQMSLGFSRVWPHERYTLTMQALPWLEATLRYTNVLNRLYGPASFSGNQSYKDRSIDVKFRLIEESENLPEVAVGIRDIAGTGLFSAEYLVANRRYRNFDFMLGLGWGYLGSRGQLKNPFRAISKRFDNRVIDVGKGGKISTSAFFRGQRVSWFGGVSYITPIAGLTLKAELDGNDYQHEPQGNNQKVSSRINLGATYRLNNWLDLSVALERGDRLMFQLNIKENLKSGGGLIKLDPPPVRVARRPVSAAAIQPPKPESLENHLSEITSRLESAGYKVDQLTTDPTTSQLTAYLSQQKWRQLPRAAGRAGRIIANHAPASVEIITLVNLEAGLETHRIRLLRRDLENAELGYAAAEDMWPKALQTEPSGPTASETHTQINPQRYPNFHWDWSPGLRQHIGGPDNPYFYQILLKLNSELQFARGFSLSGAMYIDLHNNFAGLKLPSDSQLPHVRSDIKDYLKQGKNGLYRLQLDYFRQLSSDWYGKLSAGILEGMFAGAGGELLYRPHQQRWAIGTKLYKVKQREYKQQFGLRDYSVTTGHMELHYRWPYYNIHTTLSVGQYLAGDRGATLEVSRNYANGSRAGFWLTRTNVSAEQFGEGSFDKGIFISFPLDFLNLYSSRGDFNFGWRPLTRDGGQKLAEGNQLSDLLRDTEHNAIQRQWSSVLQ